MLVTRATVVSCLCRPVPRVPLAQWEARFRFKLAKPVRAVAAQSRSDLVLVVVEQVVRSVCWLVRAVVNQTVPISSRPLVMLPALALEVAQHACVQDPEAWVAIWCCLRVKVLLVEVDQ